MAVLAGGVAGSVPVFAIGLTVSSLLVAPLSLLMGALLATLSAGWVANLAAAYGTGFSQICTKSRLGIIFCVSLASAIVALVFGYAANAVVFWLGVSVGLLPPVFAVCGIAFIVVTSVAIWRLRSPIENSLGPWGIASLVLCVVWLIFLSAFGGVADLLGLVPFDLATGFPLAILFVASVVVAGTGVLLGVVCDRRYSEPSEVQSRKLDRDAASTLFVTGIAPAFLMVVILLGCRISTCGA